MRSRRRPLLWKKICIGGIFTLVAGAGCLLILLLAVSRNLPSVEQLADRGIAQSTKIYDRDKKVLLYEANSGQKRTVIPFSEIPQYAKDATITIEDEHFYKEPAFDWQAILRALFKNISYGQIVQGGSTITQQLAKNAFLSSEQTIGRKLKELVLAIQLSRRYSKDEILDLYLNQVPYGLTAYGIEQASQAYFGKPAKELNLAESALLAALLRAPSYYSPWGTHRDQLIARQKLVLQKMHDRRKISKQELDAALKTKLVFQPQAQGIKAPHFVIAVEDYLVSKYGEDMVREGGLSVVTTLNWNLQQAAEKAVWEGAKDNEAKYKGKNAALVAEDPKTGQILALVGSRNYFDIQQEGNFNVATQGLRQPGSALKPFVYVTGFQKGYTPETILFDTPTEFSARNPECPPTVTFENNNKACFHPEDYDRRYRGPVSIREALAQSINIPAVKMLYLVGLPEALETLQNFGITTLKDQSRYGLSLVLGGGEVHLIDLVGAYSVLARDGVKHEQTMIKEVRDRNGNILESYEDRATAVIDPQYARLINDILSDVQTRSGLFQSSLSLTVFPDYDIALKTGTSNDYRDAWAMGYTPSLVVGVWAGNNDNTPMQRQGSSILAAIPIWHNFMATALQGEPQEAFTRPGPTASQKPVLRGQVIINNEVHSILYYVDRRDPDGASPANPESDPQFANWEAGVLSWAKNRDLSRYAQVGTESTGASAPKIMFEAPTPGSFVQGELLVRARITSNHPLQKITVYFNNTIVNELQNINNTAYNLTWQFSPSNLEPQNILRIEATNQGNGRGEESVIVYK